MADGSEIYERLGRGLGETLTKRLQPVDKALSDLTVRLGLLESSVDAELRSGLKTAHEAVREELKRIAEDVKAQAKNYAAENRIADLERAREIDAEVRRAVDDVRAKLATVRNGNDADEDKIVAKIASRMPSTEALIRQVIAELPPPPPELDVEVVARRAVALVDLDGLAVEAAALIDVPKPPAIDLDDVALRTLNLISTDEIASRTLGKIDLEKIAERAAARIEVPKLPKIPDVASEVRKSVGLAVDDLEQRLIDTWSDLAPPKPDLDDIARRAAASIVIPEPEEIDIDEIAKKAAALVPVPSPVTRELQPSEIDRITERVAKLVPSISPERGPMGRVAEVEAWSEKSKVEDGDLVTYEGELWQWRGLKATTSAPGSSETWVKIAARGADGKSFKWRGKWEEGLAYQDGEVVAADGGSWICTKDGTRGRPGKVDGWSIMAMRGKERKGRDGEDGVGIVEITQRSDDPDAIDILLTSAEMVTLRFPVSKTVRKLVDQEIGGAVETAVERAMALTEVDERDGSLPIRRFRGAWDMSAEYSTGDVVRYGADLWLCTESVERVAPPEVQDNWINLVTVLTGGAEEGQSGGGGGGGGGIANPASTGTAQVWTWHPSSGQQIWRTYSDRYRPVASQAARLGIASSDLAAGAMVYQIDTEELYVYRPQSAGSNTANDWLLLDFDDGEEADETGNYVYRAANATARRALDPAGLAANDLVYQEDDDTLWLWNAPSVPQGTDADWSRVSGGANSYATVFRVANSAARNALSPSSLRLNDIAFQLNNGSLWAWNAPGSPAGTDADWTRLAYDTPEVSGDSPVIVSDAEPSTTGLAPGVFWFKESDPELYALLDDGFGTLTWVELTGGGAGSNVIVSSTEPSTAGLGPGVFWWDDDDLQLFILAEDAGSGLAWMLVNGGDSSASTEIAALQSDMTSAQSDILALESSMATAQSDISALEADVAAIDGGRDFATIADMVASDATYTDFPVGTVLSVKSKGFLYQVMPGGTADPHFTTTGGGSVLINVIPVNGRIHADAFGADPTGVADSTDAFNAAMQYAVANKVPGDSSGVYRMTGTLTPGGTYKWDWGVTELNFVSADPGDLTVIKYNPQGSSTPQDSSNVVAFDTRNMNSCANIGFLTLVGANVPNMKYASRAAIPANVVAISSSDTNSADNTWGTIHIRGFGYGLWQGDQRGTAPNILPYTRWNIGYLKIERCIIPLECGQSGNGFDDMELGEVRLTRNAGTSRIRGSDFGGGTLFNNGLNPDADQEAQTLSVTAGDTAATLSADNSDIIVGRHLIIDGAGEDKAGNAIWFVAKVAAKTGTSITLDRAPAKTVAAAKILINGPQFILTSSHMRMSQVYLEECHVVPMQLDGLSSINGILKCSAGDCSSYAFGCGLVIGNQASADVTLHAKTALTADVAAHIGIVSAKDGSNVFSSGAVRVTSCGTYANLTAAVDPVKLISFYDGNAGSGSVYALGDYNPQVDMTVRCADGEYKMRNYGTVAKPAYKLPLELSGVKSLITAAVNSGAFGSPAGGSSVKASGSTGYLYHTVTAGKRYKVVVAISARDGGAPELRWHNAGTLVETMCKCGYEVGRYVMFGDAPAGVNQLRLFGFNSGASDTYTVSEFTVEEVLSV